jgi:hypothetical protein
VTRALPFTETSLARAIKGVERAGRFVIGVMADGTLIVGDKFIEMASVVPGDAQSSTPSKVRMGDYFNGGQGEARRP